MNAYNINISELIDTIQQKGRSIGTAEERQELLAAATALVQAIESPIERVARLSWYDVSISCAVTSHNNAQRNRLQFLLLFEHC